VSSVLSVVIINSRTAAIWKELLRVNWQKTHHRGTEITEAFSVY